MTSITIQKLVVRAWGEYCSKHEHLSNSLSEFPHVEVIPAVVNQMAGSDATVMCSGYGAPPPELSWSLNSSDHPSLTTSHEVTFHVPLNNG